MSGPVHGLGPEDLPEILPIFPLTGALLLPRGHLPLNVFEPRYLYLAEDALGSGRMIGLVQPVAPESDPVADSAPVYGIGCSGRIVSFSETDDGRFLLTLLGVARFRILNELEIVRGYRRAAVGYDSFLGDLEEDPGAATDRPRLLAVLRAFFDLKEIDADWTAIDDAPDEALINSLAMICPFEPSEKQALLESPGLVERSALLTTLMEMDVHESEGTSRLAAH